MNDFADRLRHARKLRRLTQADLARKAQLSQGAIGNYETGNRGNPKFVFRLAEALQVNARWLAHGEGPMQIAEEAAEHRYQLRDVSPAPHARTSWPFKTIEPDALRALPEQDLAMVENTLAALIESLQRKNRSNR